MTQEELRKRGAPQGNQNARKHGYYSNNLDEWQQQEFEVATTVEGLDNEIALLRVKIKSVVERDPDNLQLILQAVASLSRLIRVKYNFGKADKQGLKEAIGNVLRDIAIPLGIGIGSTFKK